jgi:hypothetical protein
MTRTTHLRFALVFGGALAVLVGGARAQDGAAASAAATAEEQLDRTPADCIVLNRIARKVGVNDRQVVFFMRGNTYYLNVLDNSCQALTKGETRLVFHAKNTGSARLARLCNTDSFTVERQTSRIGCGLGDFTPITAAEAAALTGEPVAEAEAGGPGGDEGGQRSRRNRD